MEKPFWVCDNCEKKTESWLSEKSWIQFSTRYIYVSTSDDTTNCTQDCSVGYGYDFCSKKCLNEFVDKIANKRKKDKGKWDEQRSIRGR